MHGDHPEMSDPYEKNCLQYIGRQFKYRTRCIQRFSPIENEETLTTEMSAMVLEGTNSLCSNIYVVLIFHINDIANISLFTWKTHCGTQTVTLLSMG